MLWTVAEKAFSAETMIQLREHFQDCLISRRCDPEWASHAPDLNSPDFYLWGYIKDIAYKNNPQNIHELREAIPAKIREIPKKGCVRVIENSPRCVQVCRQRRGAHLEHIMERRH